MTEEHGGRRIQEKLKYLFLLTMLFSKGECCKKLKLNLSWLLTYELQGGA